MSNLYFSSDLHYFHKNIILYSSRPFSSVEDMNEALIKNWNAVVKTTDTIYTLGDFSFGNYELTCKVLNRLNGTHHMILGNHDKMIIQNSNSLLTSGKVSSIQNYKELNFGKQVIVLFHYGQRVWNKSHHGSIHLYGHSHGSLPPHGKSVDVGVDCKEITDEYRPIHLDEIMQYMSKRELAKSDYHGVDR